MVESFSAEYEMVGTTSAGKPKNDTFIFEDVYKRQHVDHPLEIADKRDGRAGDRITFLDRLALLVYRFEHFIDVLKRHVVSQDVIRDRVDLFAIAASAMEAGEGNTLCALDVYKRQDCDHTELQNR